MPASESIYGPVKNAALDVYFALKNPSPAGAGDEDDFISNPTLATGDIQISKDGGAFANVGTLGAVTPAGGRVVKQALIAAEMNADVIVLQVVDQTATEAWQAHMVIIYTSDIVRSTTPANTLSVDSSGRIDVASFLGQAVTISGNNNLDVNIDEISDDAAVAATWESYLDGGANMPVDMVKISGDAAAADALESFCDGNDNMPVHVVEFTSSFDFSTSMKSSLETAVANKLDAAIPGSPTAHSINERIKAIDVLTEASGGGDLASMKTAIDTGGVKIDLAQALSESPVLLTVGGSLYAGLASVVYKRARSGTVYTIYNSGATPWLSFDLDSATNPVSLTPQ